MKTLSSTAAKSLAVVIAVAVLLALALVAGPVRKRPPSEEGQAASPAQSVAALISAEKNGDAAAYLDCFTGPLREKLKRRIAQKSTDQLAAELHHRSIELTGHVITDVDHTGSDAATLILERIYPQYNERHRVHLRQTDSGWKISHLEPLGRLAPDIPYGTPVVPETLPSDGQGASPNRE